MAVFNLLTSWILESPATVDSLSIVPCPKGSIALVFLDWILRNDGDIYVELAKSPCVDIFFCKN